MGFALAPKDSPNISGHLECESDKVKYPKRLRHNGKGRVLATIYKRPDCYRLYWRARVSGKPRSMSKDFPNYTEAKAAGDKKAGELSRGHVSSLTPGQTTDAMAALERLRSFYQATGRSSSLLAGISEFCEAAARLPAGLTMSNALEGYLLNVASVRRVEVNQAVEQFIESRRLKTVPRAEGRRPELSPEHHYLTGLWLREFAGTFPGTALCDLTKDHVDRYMAALTRVGPKTRNERRGVVKMLLRWAVEKDYLALNHRLLESGGLKHEPVDLGEIECYTAKELREMLARACKMPAPAAEGQEPEADYRDLLPIIALAGLAGLRFKEITRLVWGDVFETEGHIEVKAAKSKTRSRRLIPTCPALAAWLRPYRDHTGPVWPKGYDMLHEDFAALRESLGIPNRRNGLRHAYVSAHFAAYSDENLTAAQADNSPAMIHAHYKGLLTKAEGLAWFAVKPAKAAGNVLELNAASASA